MHVNRYINTINFFLDHQKKSVKNQNFLEDSMTLPSLASTAAHRSHPWLKNQSHRLLYLSVWRKRPSRRTSCVPPVIFLCPFPTARTISDMHSVYVCSRK
jgi:hypothetical protein